MKQAVLDTRAPVLDVMIPVGVGISDQGFVRLELTAFDPNPFEPLEMDSGREVKVFVNGERKENLLENRLVIERFPVSGAGANSVTITVEDEAGNVTERTVTWTVDPSSDTVPPTISGVNVAEDTDAGVGTGVTTVPDVSEIWVQGMLDDPKANVRYSVNAGEFREFNILRNNAGNYQFCGLVPLESGADAPANLMTTTAQVSGLNTLAIEVYDIAGNVSAYDYTLNRSTHKIEITSHTPESFANGAPQNISGKISAMIGGEAVTAVTVNGVAVASGDLVDNGDGTLTFTANAVPPATDGSMTSIDVGAETASGKKFTANAARIEGYEILYRNVRRSWSQKWHIVNSRTSLNMLFGDIDLYDPAYSSSNVQKIRYFAPNDAKYGAVVVDTDITRYPPLGSFWVETGMITYNITGGDNSAIAAALVANKGNSHLLQAGMWREYKHFSPGASLNPLPSIDVLYQKYSTVMVVKKPLGDGKLGEKVKILLSFSGMTYERFDDSPPLDLNLVKYKGEKPFSVDPATATAAYLVEVQRGEGFTITGSDFEWPTFTKTTVTRDPVDPNKTTSKTEDRGRFSFESVHNREVKGKVLWVLVNEAVEYKAEADKAAQTLAAIDSKIELYIKGSNVLLPPNYGEIIGKKKIGYLIHLRSIGAINDDYYDYARVYATRVVYDYNEDFATQTPKTPYFNFDGILGSGKDGFAKVFVKKIGMWFVDVTDKPNDASVANMVRAVTMHELGHALGAEHTIGVSSCI